MPFRIHQRHTGVEDHIRASGNERVIGKTFVHARILDAEDLLGLNDGVCTKGELPWRLGSLQPLVRLEPLSVVVNKAHQGYGSSADGRCQMGDVVIILFGQRVEDVIIAKRG